MKFTKSIFTLLFASLIFQLGNSQWALGVKGGLNFANAQMIGTNINIRPNLKTLGGGTAGVIIENRVSNKISISGEINYVDKGFIADANYDLKIQDVNIPLGVTAITRLRYVDIPLIMKYHFHNTEKIDLYAAAGGYFGYGLNGNLRTRARVIIDFNVANTPIDLGNENFDRTEFGAVVGIGMGIPTRSGQFVFDARYSHAYNPILDDFFVDVRLRNRGFSLGLGYIHTFTSASNDKV